MRTGLSVDEEGDEEGGNSANSSFSAASISQCGQTSSVMTAPTTFEGTMTCSMPSMASQLSSSSSGSSSSYSTLSTYFDHKGAFEDSTFIPVPARVSFSEGEDVCRRPERGRKVVVDCCLSSRASSYELQIDDLIIEEANNKFTSSDSIGPLGSPGKGGAARCERATFGDRSLVGDFGLIGNLIAAICVDLWLFDSEILPAKIKVSAVEHPGTILQVIGERIAILGEAVDTFDREKLSAAFLRLAALANIIFPPFDPERSPPVWMKAIRMDWLSLCEACDTRGLQWNLLLEYLKPRWEEIMKGSHRYISLLELCANEPVFFIAEVEKNLKFQVRVNKWTANQARLKKRV